MDPGGFGAVTITKSITIDGSGGNVAGVLVSGTNGINVSAGVNDIVVLRNLDIDGLATGSGTRGVEFSSGKELIIDNCNVYGFSQRNISIESSTTGATALISNSLVHDGLNNGIVTGPLSPGVTNNLVIDNVRVVGHPNSGVFTQTGTTVQIRNSVLSNNVINGLIASTSTVDVQAVLLSNNGTGILASNSAVVRVANASVVGNATGLSITGGATIYSFGNNQLANQYGNSGFAPISQQ